MKKLQIFKQIVFIIFALVSQIGYSQTNSSKERAQNLFNEIVASLPTMSQINNSNRTPNMKQLLLDIRKTFIAIAESEPTTTEQTLTGLILKLDLLTKEVSKNVIVMQAKDDNRSPQENEEIKSAMCGGQLQRCWTAECGKIGTGPVGSNECFYQCKQKYFECLKSILPTFFRTDLKTRGPGTATQK